MYKIVHDSMSVYYLVGYMRPGAAPQSVASEPMVAQKPWKVDFKIQSFRSGSAFSWHSAPDPHFPKLLES